MAYQDKNGMTSIIPSERNKLFIALDNVEGNKVPVLLFTPKPQHPGCYIPLTREQVVEMLHWIQAYLQDTTE
jgi:hypothetical protein